MLNSSATSSPAPSIPSHARPATPDLEALFAQIDQLVAAGSPVTWAIVEVWEAHEVADVEAFLHGLAARFRLTNGEAGRVSRRLCPPWEKIARPRTAVS